MKHAQLRDMVGGWFIGDFDPTVVKTDAFEMAVKKYKEGDIDASHFHKVATEITFIVSGRALMGDHEWKEGDIVVVEPGDVVQFRAITDVTLAVVKIPSITDDKYLS